MRVCGRRPRGPLVLTVLTGLAALLLAASPGPAATAEPRAADPLQQRVDAIHDTGAVGVFAEVTSPGAGASARAGTADPGTGRPMPWDGGFRIGSVTKTFTATIVLQLVGEGELSLEDTVGQWLPEVVRGSDYDGGLITVRDLLRHTSGLPEAGPEIPALHSAEGYRAERFRTYSPEELVRLAMRHPPAFPPGTDWGYSNTNYVLAAMIIQEVTGRSWAREVDERIIQPLDLSDTVVPGAFPFVPGPHARAYASFGTETDTDVTVLNPSMAVGAGSIISTAQDLNRFHTALLGGDLLAPARLDEMTTTTPAPALGVRYGLGLAEIPLSCGGEFFGHFGELLGYHTWVGVTRDGTRSATVYVTSDGGEDTQEAMRTLVDRELCGAPS
ncbi:serine hydrolase domain-containing protein [Streptomyces profundus]|uniref:serine hydrolase domain-containing protein n=1 Tax=Streptomyces profundus TaxID=2867410 RepID=UPI001D16FB11|nr:serine hydrolase domain-containing protein [Streptomyces sp. MA3_2.13]UED87240.1 beta-lactamase family protein [Streptomyces sp. MA3_2.13]